MSKRKDNNKIRIIAGQWRGKRLALPNGTSVRPTPDRVRETVFNWLTPRLFGARCLDLFAGSGVLGLEALSRGAKQVTFVEQDRRLCEALRKHLHELGASCQATVETNKVGDWLKLAPTDEVDICFLDPPYEQTPLPVLEVLSPLLAKDSLVYVERPDMDSLRELEEFGTFHRISKAGRVHFGLLAPYSPTR